MRTKFVFRFSYTILPLPYCMILCLHKYVSQFLQQCKLSMLYKEIFMIDHMVGNRKIIWYHLSRNKVLSFNLVSKVKGVCASYNLVF